MDKLLRKQYSYRELINTIATKVQKPTSKTRSQRYFEKILQELDELWVKFKATHEEILGLHQVKKLEGDSYLEDDIRDEVEEAYLTADSYIMEEIEKLNPSTSKNYSDDVTNISQRESTANTLKLPKISLEKFAGDYELWPSFHDLFKTLIHNNNQLASVEKLQYLKVHLTGESANLLRHFQITDENYKAAWDMLVERYDNKRILVNTQLKRLFSQSNLNYESQQGIKGLVDTTNEALQSLSNMGIICKDWDPILIYLITQKLPIETRQLWEQSISDTTSIPAWSTLAKFLEGRFRTLEAMEPRKYVPPNRVYQSNPSRNFTPRIHVNTLQVANKPGCHYCKRPHILRACPDFKSFTNRDRLTIVQRLNLCINCLGSGHMKSKCPSQQRCFICNNLHHTLIHTEDENTTQQKKGSYNHQTFNTNAATFEPRGEETTFAEVHTLNVERPEREFVLLATALVNIQSPITKEKIIVKALIDPGSQTSFISESVMQFLTLERESVTVVLRGVGQTPIGQAKTRVSCIVRSLYDEAAIEVQGFVMPKITELVTPKKLQKQHWPHFKNIRLADPQFAETSKIDVLLGADVYDQILLEGFRKGAVGSPIAQNTIFGWILTGKMKDAGNKRITIDNFHVKMEIEDQLRKFWEVEELGNKIQLTEEEQKCEYHFKKTHRRLQNGKYEVSLPLHSQNLTTLKIGRSRHIAIARLLTLERQFTRDKKLKDDYTSCLEEYVTLGHMVKITNIEQGKSHIKNYLPHHGVKKETSTTTKLRVVFDASRPTATGISLNDIMMKGAVVQEDLMTILLRWRKHRVALTADIEKMYRQIAISPQHADYQRIVWRKSLNDPIQDFKLTTVTFGTKSAPYLATRVLKQLALDEALNYPIGSERSLEDFYVDDFLSGADTIESALVLQRQASSLLEAGGFLLRKWASNCNEILEHIPKEHREINFPLDLNGDETIKTLGIQWNPSTDTFHYIIQSLDFEKEEWTKRLILSVIAKLFDPLGWIAPIIIRAKLIMQQLWLSNKDWDEAIGSELSKTWDEYRTNIIHTSQIKINRWLNYSRNDQKVEIHGFSDASMHAYSAAVYLCTTDQWGKRKVHLITAKTRVAPIKTISLPRLELCGAHLLAKLLVHVTNALKFNHEYTLHAWTDSEIVLAWLNSHPSKKPTFVANRISEIHQLLKRNIWNHVASKENPADCASRGLTPLELSTFDLWWHGPPWLKLPTEQWPKKSVTCNSEKQEVMCLQAGTTQIVTQEFWSDLESRFSSYNKLLRVTAYIRRFVNNIQLKNKKKNSTDPTKLNHLTTQELKEARNLWIINIQNKYFSSEINSIRREKSATTGRLLKLNPFLDKDGILRVGGRLTNSELTFNEKHPIILPDNCEFTKLLINKFHKDTLHGATQLMMNTIIKEYWILNAKNTIRHHIHKCLICHRQKARVQTQLMGNLPEVRVNMNRPFSHTGIDYCGPFELKTYKGRCHKKYKAYIALFICMSIKAIHLEVVTDLSSEGFVAAYRRFSSRRGKCSEIYCDNGTNFVGAEKLLKKQKQQLLGQINKEIAELLENDGVRFNFIPPGSPHFGGLWEAGVKSTKTHLRKILGNAILTYEEFTTVLNQIEACLNSRPLTELKNDPEDICALTPAHFLIGDNLLTPPEPSLADLNIHRLDRWQYCQRLYQTFWKRWKTEYLSRLQLRPKWNAKTSNIKIDDLVLIKDENLPPCHWLLARVIETHTGKDGLVRVVTIKTKNKNIIKRPIAKICLLPMYNRDN